MRSREKKSNEKNSLAQLQFHTFFFQRAAPFPLLLSSSLFASPFTMHVQKRDGRKEAVHFDKITARITKLAYGLSAEFCDPVRVFFFFFFLKCSLSMLSLSRVRRRRLAPAFPLVASPKALSNHLER